MAFSFSVQLLNPSLPICYSFKTVTRESRYSTNSNTRSSFFSDPTFTMGPRHWFFLSHYWWLIKSPYSTLVDLDEFIYPLFAKLIASVFSIQAYWLPPRFCSLRHLVLLYWLFCQYFVNTCCPLPPKKRRKTQHLWLYFAIIFETNYFHFLSNAKLVKYFYLNTSIFSATFSSLISCLLLPQSL